MTARDVYSCPRRCPNCDYETASRDDYWAHLDNHERTGVELTAEDIAYERANWRWGMDGKGAL